MGRAKHAQETTELNLLPVMNLMSIMIPLLLMSAEFVTLAVIDSALPAIGPATPDDPLAPALHLTLAIGTQGLTVLGAEEALGVAEGEGGVRIPCKGGGACRTAEDYDWQRLSEVLGQVKDLHPSEQGIVLVPDARVRYEVIVRAMDASRVSAAEEEADGSRRRLFPQAVIAGGAVQ